MFKKSVFLVSSLLSISAASYAFVPCTGENGANVTDAVVCINYKNPSKDMYVKTVFNNNANVEHMTPTSNANLFFENSVVPEALKNGMLKMQGNSMDFFTCNDKACQQSTLVGHFEFNLNNNNGNYSALPTGSYTVNLP